MIRDTEEEVESELLQIREAIEFENKECVQVAVSPRPIFSRLTRVD
jgi:hypothetical protein